MYMNNTPTTDPIRDHIMEAIRKGGVHMKPRWHFVAWAVLFAIGILTIVSVLLYTASLSLFLLRESGVWFAPSFGVRGWFALVRSIPISHVVFIIVCIVLLELLIHRYAFVYKRPLTGSILAIAALIAVGGFLIAQTSFHRSMSIYARGHYLPAPFDMPYRRSFRIMHPTDLYKGTIVSMNHDGFVIVYDNDTNSDTDDNHDTTTSQVIVTPRTRLPYGGDFKAGTRVIVEGDRVATDTVRAFGVREVDE